MSADQTNYGPVMVTVPLQIPQETLDAIIADPRTAYADNKEMHEHIGWLICAWKVMVEQRKGGAQ